MNSINHRNARCRVSVPAFLLLCLTLSGWVLSNSRAQPLPGAEQCSVTIARPISGAQVSGIEQVDGVARKPSGQGRDLHLWVFAHRTGLAGWWPQGGGETKIVGGRWMVTAFFGEPRDIGRAFEIAAVFVEDNEHAKLLQWVQTTIDTGRYPPVNYPNAAPGCAPSDVVTVQKAS